MRYAFALLLAGCSFIGIHYPDSMPPSAMQCSSTPPIIDTTLAVTAFGAGAYRYGVEQRTSPFPLSMLVVGAWATASAIYGYVETARCNAAP